MTRDQERLEAAYEQNARQIAALLDEGKTVAFSSARVSRRRPISRPAFMNM